MQQKSLHNQNKQSIISHKQNITTYKQMHQQKPIPLQQSSHNNLTKPTKLPTLHQKAAFNQIYIKGHRPLAVYIKHGKKVLQKTNTIFIHGMTATILKAIRVAQALRKQFPYLKYIMESDSVPAIEKYQDKGEYGLKERSCVHIRLDKNFTSEKKEKM